MKKQILFRRCRTMLALAVIIGISLICITGCTDAQNAEAKSAVVQLQAFRAATTQATADAQQAVDQTQAQLATLPANDPGRKQLESLLAKATDALKTLNDKSAKLDQAIDLANALVQKPSPNNPLLDTAASSLGAYGILGLAALRFGYAEVDRYRKSKALTQTVAGLAQSDLTPEQKTSLASAQDVTTKVLITQIKGA